MTAVVVLVVGLPGTGKLTVASALCERLRQQGRDVRLVDNHHVADPILSLVAQDGVSHCQRRSGRRSGRCARRC